MELLERLAVHELATGIILVADFKAGVHVDLGSFLRGTITWG